MARHRTVEAYLVKVMGIPWDEVHEEAHAMEHSISPRLETKMLEMIGEVRTCPHGHPIGDYPREPGEAMPAVPVGSELSSCGSRTRPRRCCTTSSSGASSPATATRCCERRGHGDDAVTELGRPTAARPDEVDDRLARTVSVVVSSRGDGPVSDVVEAGAELQLLGPTRWGM